MFPKWFRAHKHELWPLENYKYIDFEGVYSGERGVHNPGKEGYRYDIIHPETNLPCKPPLMGYRFPEGTMKKMIENGQIIFGETEDKLVEIKVYAKDYKQKLSSVFNLDGRAGANELKDLFPEYGKVFTNPKTIKLLSDLISFGTNDGDIVLDFFSGSGSTAHAVFEVNAILNGNRKFISVQIDEPTGESSESRKAGYNTIYDVTKERVVRASKKVKEIYSQATCDFGFKEFKTIAANNGAFAHYLDDADTMEDYVSFNAMALDNEDLAALLTTWKVYDGLPLHQDLVPIDLGGYTAHLGEHILYFAHKGLELTHITEMLRRIDEEDDFAPRKLVVFHYVFGDKILREFSEAVNAPNRKHLELTFEQRF